MERFIRADLAQMCIAEQEKAEKICPPQECTAQIGAIDLEPINALLKEAELNAIAREQLGRLDPHVNVLRGAKWKVLLKRLVRKLSWWMVNPLIAGQNYYNELTVGISNALRDCVCMLKDIVAQQQRQIDMLEGLVKTQKDELAALQVHMNERQAQRQRQIDMLEGLVKTQKDELAALHTQMEGQVQPQQESIADYIDYEDFENTFRGSQTEIRSRIERYLQYFRPGDRVLDLGCGRGEWLELLRGHGVEAVGVDISSSFVQVCKRKGLNVVEQDIFSYLESQPNGSLDGITSIQVIEHLTPVELAKLVQLCCSKLKLGGRLIFETQNPAVVSTMTNNFYVDPTHIRPVHPIWIKYLLEKNFFSEISLDYPEYAWVTDGAIPALDGTEKEYGLFNQRIAYLNNLLYGSTDYAVIAKR